MWLASGVELTQGGRGCRAERIRRTHYRCSSAAASAAAAAFRVVRSVHVDIKSVCAQDGCDRRSVVSDRCKPERLFYAHVRAFAVSHWMSGFNSPAERHTLHGCREPVSVPRCGIFFSQPTCPVQTQRGLLVMESPTPASSTWGRSLLILTSYLDLPATF